MGLDMWIASSYEEDSTIECKVLCGIICYVIGSSKSNLW
jgi:hypothetical protein